MLSVVDRWPSGRSGRRAASTTRRPCILSVCVRVIAHHQLREIRAPGGAYAVMRSEIQLNNADWASHGLCT